MDDSTAQAPPSDDPITIALDDEVARDPSKDVAHIELPDGSITINLGNAVRAQGDDKFGDNLAEHMDDSDLWSVADDLLSGIEEDDRSRADWLEERADGIKLLALKIEKPDANAEGAAQNKSRSTLLLEAVLRFQANASGELMPVDGPAKIRDDSAQGETTQGASDADFLEKDLNHYLTVTASEYYPDTDRMLLWTGFGGSGFKKVYRCPIRRRPVSEAVDAADLIVSMTATDLGNADRITHRVKMPRATLKRMQILKAYRDIDLGQPTSDQADAVQGAKDNVSGISGSPRPQDEQFTIYECYCQIDLPGYEDEENGEPTGLPLPYKIVVDKTSKEILEIRRNWDEDDDMKLPKEVFVKFPFVPGFGFYDLGLLHIAGNPTVAVTALQRIMIDAGIFGNFPGFLYSKITGRQQTNVLNIQPGTSVPIDTNGMPIGNAVMPLPYQKPDAATMQLMQGIADTGARVAGTAELQVGEGRQDAPVGTTIAMIEAAMKVMDAVHKRLHRAQAKELSLIRDQFKEHPEDFWRRNKKPAAQWDVDRFLAALENTEFVPASDPNTASHIQRIMRAQAIYQMAQANPQLFDIPAVLAYVLQTLNVADYESLVAKGPPPQSPPDPKAQAALISAQSDMIDSQTKAKQAQSQQQNAATENQNRDQDRQAELQIAGLGFAKEKLAVSAKLHGDAFAQGHAAQSEHSLQAKQHSHDLLKTGLGAALKPQGTA